MNKVYLVGMVSALSLTAVAVIGPKQNGGLVNAGFECQHNGYHYEELVPDYNKSGHKEFWTCCKCHGVFLKQPEIGYFVDQEDELMIGEIDEEHIAYLSPTTPNPLKRNNRKYYPIVNSSGIDGVIFFDRDMNELNATGFEGRYQLTDLKEAEYYLMTGNCSFTAVAAIESVSYNSVFQSDNIGVGEISEAFKEREISDEEKVEKLTTNGPDLTYKPLIDGVHLSTIWQVYKEYGFCSLSNSIWSCYSTSPLIAYCWNCYTDAWMQSHRESYNNMAICLSTVFN